MNYKHIGKVLAVGALLLLGVGWGPGASAQSIDPSFSDPDFDAGYDPTTGGGTTAGTTVTNTATLGFTVGGIDQFDTNGDPFEAEVEFVVDRRLNVLVTEQEAGEKLVSTFETGALISFDVANLSNAFIDIKLRVVREDSTFGTWITVGDVLICSPDCAGSTAIGELVLTDVDPDAGSPTAVQVRFDSEVPGTATNGQEERWHLVAAVANPTNSSEDQEISDSFDGTSGDLVLRDSNGFPQPPATALGIPTPDDGGVVLDVFADAPGSITHDFQDAADLGASITPAARQGQHAAVVTLKVQAADMTLTKSAEVVWDPVNGGCEVVTAGDREYLYEDGACRDNPRRIPGAIIEYRLLVANEDGAADAESLVIEDAPPSSTIVHASHPNPFVRECGASAFAPADIDAYSPSDPQDPNDLTVADGFAILFQNSCAGDSNGELIFYVEIQ